MAHVINTLQTTLSPETDPFYGNFGTPEVLQGLIKAGALGQKTKAGFYKKVGRDVLRFDEASQDYVPGGEKADEVYGRMLKKPAADRLKLLRHANILSADLLTFNRLKEGSHEHESVDFTF